MITKISKNVISVKDSNNKEVIYVTQSYCTHKYNKERGRINRLLREEWYGRTSPINEKKRLKSIIAKQHEDIIKLQKEKEALSALR